MEQSIAVRHAGERDYPAIARIQAECAEAAQWPVGDYSQFRTLLALVDGQPAGFLAWRQTVADEAELLNAGVAKAYRRRGVARAMLQELRRVAAGDIFLEVAEDNTGARRLYESEGWEAVSVRTGYYQPGNRNAVVMVRRSCYSPG